MRGWAVAIACLVAGCQIELNPDYVDPGVAGSSGSTSGSETTSATGPTTTSMGTETTTTTSATDSTSGDPSGSSGGTEGFELPPGAIVVLHMDEPSWSSTGVALDASGNERHFLPTGDAQTAPDGVRGRAGSFDGAGDFLEDEDAETYLAPLSAMTVSVWIRADQIGTDRGILSGRVPNDGDSSIVLRHDGDGMDGGQPNVIKVAMSGTVSNTTQLESSADAQTTDWQHLAFVWQADQPLQLYIDGVLDTPSSVEAPSGGTINFISTLMVGRSSKDVTTGDGWAGLIDELAIWDRALSASEIADIYAGTPS